MAAEDFHAAIWSGFSERATKNKRKGGKGAGRGLADAARQGDVRDLMVAGLVAEGSRWLSYVCWEAP